MKHLNPYRVDDPKNMFEVGENSSHPELDDNMRVWKFRDRTFRSATEIQKYFENEGLNPKAFWMKPVAVKESHRNTIYIHIVERCSPEERNDLQDLHF